MAMALTVFRFLIPIRHGQTGKCLPDLIIQEFDEELYSKLGGWTKHNICFGAWPNSKGVKVFDKSVPYEIAIKNKKDLYTLKSILTKWKLLFGQEEIYFLLAGRAEFL